MAIAIQDEYRVVLLEVFPLEKRMREDLVDGFDKLLEELVVGLTTKPRVSVADVERIGKQTWIVRSDIEGHGQGERGVDAGAGGV